jgi:hypothetical protein
MKITKRQLRKLILQEIRVDTKNPLDYVPDGPMKDNIMDLINDPDKDVQRQGYELAQLLQEPTPMKRGNMEWEDTGYEGSDYLDETDSTLLNREEVIGVLDTLFEQNPNFDVKTHRFGGGFLEGKYIGNNKSTERFTGDRYEVSIGFPGYDQTDWFTKEFPSGKSKTWLSARAGYHGHKIFALRISKHDDDDKGHLLRDVIRAYNIAIKTMSALSHSGDDLS